MTKRRQISLLPQVHQTDALRRFFNSTVDQVFEEGKTVPVSGYIGRKPSYYDPAKDFYKAEPTPARERYQLEPMMISADDNHVMQSQLFYDDLLSRLNQEGALTSNPNRLFSAGYYSWAPPIDIDRIMNFQQYYWAGADSTALILTVPGVEVGAKYYGDGVAVSFNIPPTLASRNVAEENVTVVVDGIKIAASQFTVGSGAVVFHTAPAADSLVLIFRYGNIADGVETSFAIPAHCHASQNLSTVYAFVNGREAGADEFTVDLTGQTVTFATPPAANSHVMVTRIKDLKALIAGHAQFDPTGLTLYTLSALIDGLQIKLVDPVNFLIGYDLKAYGHPWDEIGHSTYFVEGCDISITLIEVPETAFGGEGYVADDPRYVVIARSDKTRSFWSRVNRWVHRDALVNAEDAVPANQAKRPIIEYLADIQQFNYGSYRVQNTSGKVSNQPNWNGTLINFTDMNGLPEGSVTIDDGYSPNKGDVIFVNLPNGSSLNNRLYYVDTVATDNDPLTQVYVLQPLAVLQEGAITTIKDQEYWFDGVKWVTVSKDMGDAPLFDLYDADGISLADSGVYPASTFTGAAIFDFAQGTGKIDSIVKRKLKHDTYGQIVFENQLETRSYSYRDGPITGYKYYRRDDKYLNAWHKADASLVQAIDANNVSSIPLNLQANPDFDVPLFLSRNDFFAHFASILENQTGFEGKPYARNNWYKTAKDVTKGLVIIQHEAPLLKLMGLMESADLSVTKAIRFVDREYARIKAKFIKTVAEINMERDVAAMSADDLAVLAMKRVSAGRTNNFPFHDSTVGNGSFFIPLTPALIGITPLYKPVMFDDDTFGLPVTFIRGHDGSCTATFGDYRDAALLAFETRIYNSAHGFAEQMPLIDLVEGKNRAAPYSQAELTQVMMPSFERWARENNVNFENSTFDEADPFTWNYRSCTDRYGNPVRGHWRGIYVDFFDTDKPHLEPWVMLGFSQKPDWWETQYGPAPYTRGNAFMWEDIEAGIIKDGPRAGTYTRFARPDLHQILPIDLQGNLLDPFAATIILAQPPLQFAKMGWQFGDHSNIEAIWHYTSSYQFSLALAKFLLRPAFFVERFWDVLNETTVHQDQLVQTPAMLRVHHRDLFVNGEVTNSETKKTIGIQNWLIDHLVQSGRTPSRLGSLIRGLRTQLGHKMAGFTTPDRMTISAESFGLVPREDITVSLYRSPSMTEYFYSGILIENTPTGYRLVGYNPDYPFFDLILGEDNSRKTKIKSGNDIVETPVNPWHPNVYYKKDVMVEYKSDLYRANSAHTSATKFEESFWQLAPASGKQRSTTVYKHTKSSGVFSRIEYGSEVQTKQEVADIIFAYERFLLAQGFVFSGADDSETSWTNAVRTFLRWAEIEWQDGSFITLSPSARELKFIAPRGIVIEMSNSLIDRTGHYFRKENYSVDRDSTETVITAHTDDIYGARLNKTEIEHSLIFSNTTIFNDVIFNPLYNIRQDRLKLSARVASDWSGRYEAPGFVIRSGQIIPNFTKLGEDLRDMFDIELADNTILRDHARHVIGFETRPYLDKLLLNETQQFEMYQGMIQQKGSKGALSAILRSDEVEQSRDLTFLEEWAFRIGEFGAFNPRAQMEFVIKQGDVHNEKQIVHFSTTGKDDWLNLSDTAWVSEKADFSSLQTVQTAITMPEAGYVRADEVAYVYRDLDAFGTAIGAGLICSEAETIWVTHGEAWDVRRITYPTSDLLPIVIESIDDSSTGFFENVQDIRITFDRAHQLSVGQELLLVGGYYEFFRGVFSVLRTGDLWVEIDASFTNVINFAEEALSGIVLEPPTAFVTKTLRVPNINTRNALPFGNSTMAYVDDAGNGSWKVFRKLSESWIEQRRQGKKIENSKITSGLLFDEQTRITLRSLDVEPSIAEKLTVVDPLSGLIPGIVDRELDFKLEYDPADYSSWGSEQEGMLWWNLDTVRFLNCYTDAVEELDATSIRYENEINYRSANWSKVTSTSSVDVYEWVRSTIIPDGSYVTDIEYDAGLARSLTVYYHWSLNTVTVPRNTYRRLSAKSCSEIIQNPAKAGLIWYAATSAKSMVIAGAKPILDDDGRIFQLDYQMTTYEGDEHAEWLLLSPADKTATPPSFLWNKLLDSVRGCNVDVKTLPSSLLHTTQRCGLEADQSMFGDVDLKASRKSFIRMLNYILLRNNRARAGSLEANLSVADAPPQYYYWSAHSGELALLPPHIEYDFTVLSYDELADALLVYDRVLLDNRAATVPSWSIWKLSGGQPTIMKAYDRVVENRADLNSIFLDLAFRERVLVLHDENASGFWTIWEKRGDGAWDIVPFDEFLYDGDALSSLGMMNAQKYRARDFWDFTDWYDASVDPTFPPYVTYATTGERTAVEGLAPLHEYVRILDDNGYWSWTRWDGTEWLVVAREKGTIQLDETFFTRSVVYGIKDQEVFVDVTKIADRDGTLDLTPLVEALRVNVLSTEEVNELFFSMIHFAHANIDKINWAVKTSFMSVLGFNERLWASPVAVAENMPLLLEYINEAKPYRVKVRDVLRTAAPDIEKAQIVGTDFDKPSYFDVTDDAYRRLNEGIDDPILAQGLYRHYTGNPDKRRTVNVSMLFDRIWPEANSTAGAADRIMAFYQPGTNMREKNLTELLNLDFKGTIYDGSTLGDTDYDIILRGTNSAGSQIDLNVEGGFKLRDPRAAKNKPQELISVGCHDGLVFRIHDRWGNGVPRHTVKHYDVSRRKIAAISLDVGDLVDSITVFIDGVRVTNFVFDQLGNQVTVTIVPGTTQQVAIHGFGFAAVDRIREQLYFKGGAASYAMVDADQGLVEVSINGVPVTQSSVTVALDTVTIPATSASDTVMITGYTSNNPRPMRQQTETFTGAGPFQLTKLPEQRPYHAAMIVEKNGLRLTPTRTYYSLNEPSYWVNHSVAADIRVWDDRTSTSHPVVDISTFTSDVFDNAQSIREAFVGDPARFVLWDKSVVFLDIDGNARQYVITVQANDAFTVSETGLLTLSTPLANGESLMVTTFSNDTKIDIRTHVFSGDPVGFYSFRTTHNGRAWLTVNGRRLIENIDFAIEDSAAGSWDIDPFETFIYDAPRFVQVALFMPLIEADSLVITTFDGRENNADNLWQLSTTTPSEMRLLPVDSDGDTMYVVRKAWEILSLDPIRRSGGLVLDIAPESSDIILTLNPQGAPAAMIPSQPLLVPDAKSPAVVWIDGERIEYFGYSRSGNTVTLSQLRRGTRGTAMLAHTNGTLALAGHDLDRLPPAPDGPEDDDPSGTPSSGGGNDRFARLKSNLSLTASFSGTAAAPASGTAGVLFNAGQRVVNDSLVATDSMSGIVSMWVYMPDTQSVHNAVFYACDPANNYINYASPLAATLQLAAGWGNNAVFEYQFFTSAEVVPSGVWNHYLIAFNSDAARTPKSRLVVYRNRTLLAVGTQHHDSNIAFSAAFNAQPFWVGADQATNAPIANHSMADFWLDLGHNIIENDGTISPANLDKFIDISLKPVNLGNSGEIPTGSPPVVFLHRNPGDSPDAFANNLGTGGAFTVSAPLSASPTNP